MIAQPRTYSAAIVLLVGAAIAASWAMLLISIAILPSPAPPQCVAGSAAALLTDCTPIGDLG